MKRREFLRAGALTLTLPLVRGWADSVTERRPNVVFISVDDLNDWVGHLGGHPDVRTPNMDRLANSGAAFTRAYCSAPACNPSRVSVMTGMRPSSSEVYSNFEHFRDYIPEVVTLPQQFRAAGYRVAGGGKLFHGHFAYVEHPFGEGMPESLPWRPFDVDQASWDEYFLFPDDPVPAQSPLNGFAKKVFDWGPSSQRGTCCPDDALAQWAVDFLGQPQARPFFLGVGFFRPHLPWYVPKQYFEQYPLDSVTLPPFQPNDLDDVPKIAQDWARKVDFHHDITSHGAWRKAVQAYLASISYADAQVGRLIDALEAGPYADNTIVVLWSDHGWHLG